MQNVTRTYIDCRDYPSESKCSLRIAGTEEEVLRTATSHAVSVHGHSDGPQLHENLRKALKAEN